MVCRDYEEFIAALNAESVRYLVVGAFALAHHARPRATKDLDILLEPTAENAARALAALRRFFGGVDLGYSVSDFIDRDTVIQLGVAPVRIDLICELSGCPDFNTVWENRVSGNFGSVPTWYLGIADMIRTKEATGRPQDIADLRLLRRIGARNKPKASRRKRNGNDAP